MIKKKKVLTLGFSSAPKPEPISAEKKYFPVKAEEKGEANFSTSRKVTPFLLSLQRKTYLPNHFLQPQEYQTPGTFGFQPLL